MPQAKFVVKCKSTYGKKGDVIELNTDKLTDRQAVMLEPYKAPEVKSVKTESKADKK